MEKQTQVLDASVIVKWFSKEELTSNALELKEKHISGDIIITLPDIVFIEVTNALRYKDNNEEALLNVNKSLWNMEFKIEKINEMLLSKAIIIAKKHNITIYDAVYVALAQIYNSPLITTDTELYKIPNVIPLENV